MIFKALLPMLSLLLIPTTHAAAPMHPTQAPGYYRVMVGDFEVTAINDGTFAFPVKLIQHSSPKAIKQAMKDTFVPEGDTVPTSVNAFLINTGGKLILVDTGVANAFGPMTGHFAENFKASGYQGSQVDLVLLTHMHGDHTNGLLTPDGKPMFPNAVVMASKPEADYWLSKENAEKAPKEMAPFFKMAQDAVAPYQKADKFKTFEPNAELSTGIHAMATGHTPGHSSFVVKSMDHELIVTGDVVHIGMLQFANPDISVGFDTDDKHAIATRKQLFASAAKNGTLLAGAHIAFPGLGHVRAQGKGFVWVPIMFGGLK